MAPPLMSPTGELAAALGNPIRLGVYNATTTSKTNAEVGTPFYPSGDGLAGKVLCLYNAGSVDVHLLPVATSTGTVSSTITDTNFGVPLLAGSARTLRMSPGMPYLAIVAASGTANVAVWELV